MSQKRKRKTAPKNKNSGGGNDPELNSNSDAANDPVAEVTEWEKSVRRIKLYVVSALVVVAVCSVCALAYWIYVTSKPADLEEQCVAARRVGDWQTLEIKAREWATWEPDNAKPWMYAATAVEESGGDPKMIAGYLKFLPDDSPAAAFQKLSDILYQSGEVKDAAKIFQKMVDRDPDSIEAHRRLNFYYVMTRQRTLLIKESERAIDSGAAIPETFVYLVGADWVTFTNGYEMVGRWAEKYPQDNEKLEVASAIHLISSGFAESMTENPRLKALLANRAGLIASLKKKYPQNIDILALQLSQATFLADDETVREILSSLEIDVDNDSRFWRFKGWYHAFHEQWKEAEAAYQTCLELNPYDWLCMHELSSVLRQLEKNEEMARIQKISFDGKQIQRDVLQAKNTASLPPEILNKIAKYIRDCGQPDAASKLSGLISRMK